MTIWITDGQARLAAQMLLPAHERAGAVLDPSEIRYLRKLVEADLRKHRRSVPKLRQKLGDDFDRVAEGRTDGRSAAERTEEREGFLLGLLDKLYALEKSER